MPKSISIVGEPFLKYVRDQINTRQKIYGSGINDQPRTPAQISYLNSRNAWLKVASSVNILNSDNGDNPQGLEGRRRLQRIFRSNKGNIDNLDNFKGSNLSKNFVLFNGTSAVDDEGNYTKRAGVTQDLTLANNSAYGLGGTEFGIQPMPGISLFNVNHYSNGSLRDATLNITAYNRFQFDVIETLYLRLGYTMMVEWGNNIYFEKVTDENYKKVGSTIIDKWWFNVGEDGSTHLEALDQIEKYRRKYHGNYDGFVGVVKNFRWSIEPDGTYNIEIQLVSLGSVIESLKVDVLHPHYTFKPKDPNTPIPPELNQTSIGNYLFAQRNPEHELPGFLNIPANVSNNFGEVDIINLKDKNLTVPVNIDDKYTHYIRLGHFMYFLEQYICTYNINKAKCAPSIKLNFTTESLCTASPELISIDPRICVIKPNTGYMEKANIPLPDYFEVFSEFFVKGRTSTEFFGQINNIYINFELILSKIPKNTRELSLGALIDSILTSINSCFGGEIKLFLDVDESKNQAVIRDENLRPGLKVDLDENNKVKVTEYPESDYPAFNWLGYDRATGTSNFLQAFSFETTLSNNFVNQISIGATANNRSVNEDATAYSRWSIGLEDRFQRRKEDGAPNNSKCQEQVVYLEDLNNPEEEPTPHSWERTKAAFRALIVPTVTEWLYNIVSTFFKNESSRIAQNKENRRKALEAEYYNWNDYLINAFVDVATGLGGSAGTGGGGYQSSIDPRKYLFFNEDFIERGRAILATKNTTKTLGNISQPKAKEYYAGYLPAELSLTFDGFSGVRIYNGLKLDASLLPHNYPSELDFIIIGVDHSLTNNDWTTTLRAIITPQRAATDNIAPDPGVTTGNSGSISDTDRENIDDDEDIVETETFVEVFQPLNTLQVRNDIPGGLGHFGAKRDGGTRIHRGVDYLTSVAPLRGIGSGEFNLSERFSWINGMVDSRDLPVTTNLGTRVYAPITGNLTTSKAFSSSVLPGFKIYGTGEYEGYTAFVFYCLLDNDLINRILRSPDIIDGRRVIPISGGAPIARAVNLSVDYNKNVSDHIHFAIKNPNGDYLNAENASQVKYTSRLGTGGFRI